MAVVKVCKGGRSLGAAIKYAAKNGITRGKDCDDNPDKALEQMKTTKEVWEQIDGRQYKHYVISFLPGEASIEQAQKIADKWAKANFPTNEVFAGIHIDKEHLHIHFIVNSVDFEDGHKLHLSKDDLENFKEVSDKLCLEQGLSVIDRTQTPNVGEVRSYDMNKYQTMVQGKSWTVNIAKVLDNTLQECEGKGYQSFVDNMKSQGVDVELRGSKHVTFTDQEGNKVRGATLAKTFSDQRFTKDGIESILSRQLAIPKSDQFHKMQSVTDIQRSVNGRGAGANVINNTINAEPIAKTPLIIKNEVEKGRQSNNGDRSRSGGGRSHGGGRNISREPDKHIGGGGLSMSRELSDDEQIEKLMEKGLSEEQATKLVMSAEE